MTTAQALETPTTYSTISRIPEALDAIPTEVLDRYAAEFNLSAEEAELHAREFVRYLAMCVENPAAGYGMSGQVDEVWHTFILYTRAYAQWCDQTFGRFIHHDPTPPATKAAVIEGKEEDTYASFYWAYALYFGEKPPAIWPAPHKAVDCGGGGCGGSSCSSPSCSSPSCSSPSCSSSPSSPSSPTRRRKRR